MSGGDWHYCCSLKTRVNLLVLNDTSFIQGRMKQKPKSITLVFLLNRSREEATKDAKARMARSEIQGRDTVLDI